jgi:hypothetical protein
VGRGRRGRRPPGPRPPLGRRRLDWDGAAWTSVPLPLEENAGGTIIRAISGVASNDIWAVGVFQYYINGFPYTNARAWHWDGASWTRATFPGVGGRDSHLDDVHAISTNNVWAVGGAPGEPGSGVANRYATVHWDGSTWSDVPNPNRGVLYAVAASSSTDVWAAGYGVDSLGYSTGTYTIHSTASCGDADFNDDGDSGTDQDIEAFFACLAGNCCGTCGTADFNNDGDTGTDQDIEAFFRVLAGGNC